VRLKKN